MLGCRVILHHWAKGQSIPYNLVRSGSKAVRTRVTKMYLFDQDEAAGSARDCGGRSREQGLGSEESLRNVNVSEGQVGLLRVKVGVTKQGHLTTQP